jgi:hypothetical protein
MRPIPIEPTLANRAHDLLSEGEGIHGRNQYTPMHQYAWVCDSCGLDVHTPMSRADPPPAWRIVTVYQEEEGAEPTEHHFCGRPCMVVGPLPPDVREKRRKEMERAAAIAAEADRIERLHSEGKREP